jgi:hypothetical protein
MNCSKSCAKVLEITDPLYEKCVRDCKTDKLWKEEQESRAIHNKVVDAVKDYNQRHGHGTRSKRIVRRKHTSRRKRGHKK